MRPRDSVLHGPHKSPAGTQPRFSTKPPGFVLEIEDGDPLSWDNGSYDTAMNPRERNTILVNATTPSARVEVTCDMDV